MVVIGIFSAGSAVTPNVMRMIKDLKYVSKVIGFTSLPKGDDTDLSGFDEVVYDCPYVKEYSQMSSESLKLVNIIKRYNCTHLIPTNDIAVNIFSELYFSDSTMS